MTRKNQFMPEPIVEVNQLPASAPPARCEPHPRERARAPHRAAGRRIAALDDDPTGSQCVHDVSVVTVLDKDEYAAALAEPGSTCFILTNTRSLPEVEAVALTQRAAADLYRVSQTLGAPMEIVTRGDSTLRGHIVGEVGAVAAARRAALGRGFDGVLVIPAFFEAGRFSVGDVHWAVVQGRPVAAGETEFAKDATFGYRSSNLREIIAERSGGTLHPADIASITLSDIREGGHERVTEILLAARDGRFIVVNATDYADLEIVTLGLVAALDAGRSFGYRVGPSFMRALAGVEPRSPLTAGVLVPRDRPLGHGLVVVGSHVGLTSRQVARAQAVRYLAEHELDVQLLVDPTQRDRHVAEVARAVAESLAQADTLVATSRGLVTGADADASLAIARTVSTAVIEVVQAALQARPDWVIAKGGITSHDVAVRGLGITRATVLGQLFRGTVSVLLPVEAASDAVGVPYVVFPGNVGDDESLADAIGAFQQGAQR